MQNSFDDREEINIDCGSLGQTTVRRGGDKEIDDMVKEIDDLVIPIGRESQDTLR